MAIIRRLGPEERFEKRHGPVWNKVKHYPLIYAMWKPTASNPVDGSALGLMQMLDACTSPRWIAEMSLDVKIFLYVVDLVCDRATLDSMLPEGFMAQLKRHLYALTTQEKITISDGIGLVARQIFMWDIAPFTEAHPRPGTLHLQTPAKRLNKPAKAPTTKPRPLPRPNPKRPPSVKPNPRSNKNR